MERLIHSFISLCANWCLGRRQGLSIWFCLQLPWAMGQSRRSIPGFSGPSPLFVSSGLNLNKIWDFSCPASIVQVDQFSVLPSVHKNVLNCGKTMKIALNCTGRGAMMTTWLANVEDRWQIFITSSHKQTKLYRNIKVSAMFVNNRLLPGVSQNENETAMQNGCRRCFVFAFFCTF
jgi:hypothetical protein